MQKRLAAGVIIALFAATDTSIADTVEQHLAGAWVQSSSDCKDVFESEADAVTFRQPVNKFISAFIISGKNVQAVNGTCHIGDASPEKDGYWRIKLDCQDEITFPPLDGRVKIFSDVKMSYGNFSSDPLVDATYKRCGP